MPNDDLAVVTPDEAARLLGTSRRWVYKLVARAELPRPFPVPHREHTPRRRFWLADIRRYIARRDRFARYQAGEAA